MTNRSSSLALLFVISCLYAGMCSGFSASWSWNAANINLARRPGSISWTKRCFASRKGGEATRATATKSRAIYLLHVKMSGWNGRLPQWGRLRVRMLANQSNNDEEPMQVVGLGDDTISDQAWEDIEAGAPSELSIMKEVGRFCSSD